MTIRNLKFAVQPRSVALLGASANPASLGSVVLRNLCGADFLGPIYPVNPKYDAVDGLTCYARVEDLPAGPDLAVVATPPETVPGLIEELAARGTRAAVVLTAGLTRENGLRQAMLDAACPTCFRIFGPNCFGLFVPQARLNASFAHLNPQRGRLAFLSQSGALTAAILDWACDRGIGFSKMVSLGDMADVDVGDMLDLLAGDRATDAILMYLETVTNARKFMSAARAAARVKPVILVKSGRHATAAKAAATHTGALAGADRVMDAAFRRAGLLRVLDLEELFDAAETLTRLRPIAGDRLGIVTNGGGAGVLAVDGLEDAGGTLASLNRQTIASLDAHMPATWSRANPIDIIGDADAERWKYAVDAILADEDADAVLLLNCPTALTSADEAAAAVVESVMAHRDSHVRPKPVLTAWLGGGTVIAARRRLRDAGIACFDTPSDAVRSFGYLTGWSKAQDQLMVTPPAMAENFAPDVGAAPRVLTAVAREKRTVLTEPEAKAVLDAFGIASVATLVAADAGEVEAKAGLLLREHPGVVVKLLSRDVSHKSDVGGVALDLQNPGDARLAAERIAARLEKERPDARLDGFTVQPMIRRPGAHELLLGLAEDPIFGPTVLFGAGGTAVEIVADSAVSLPPLDRKLAGDLVERTRISRLLAGYRDREAADREAIEVALVRLAQISVECPAIVSLDINPLLADASGVLALDARIVIAPERIAEKAPNVRLSIRPYPAEWDRPATTRTGTTLRLRPIRPEDERLYPDFLDKIEKRDMRLRLLGSRKAFPHRMLARMTQLDYGRDMAFVALADDGAMLGVARLSADPDGVEAEFAILVRSDLKGQGIGWALMQRLIAYSHSEGLAVIKGEILEENRTMLDMARELGFTAERNPTVPDIIDVRLDLDVAPAGREFSSPRPPARGSATRP